jgi:hypothetical protein
VFACVGIGLFPVAGTADTFQVIGRELTGETRTVAGDGSVRTVVQAGAVGLLYHAEEHELVPARALVSMSITVNGDELLGAELRYTDLGPHGVTVTVQINPCWLEYVNDREATAEDFGDDVTARLEAALPPGQLAPGVKAWLVQRLALLGAKTAEPYVKNGIVLVSPHLP